MKNELIDINYLAKPIYQKCNCCNRVQDIYFQANIKNAENKRLIQGTLQLCKSCGENLNTILGNDIPAGEEIIKVFDFTDL